tara:strand:+ start:102 stop:1079 length:978 start_codon:yes stop_codon:yes gene_type:complete
LEDTNGWYKPNIDRKLLIKLLERSNYEGWRHIIIYFVTLIFLGYFCYVFWLTWVFLPIYLIYCTWWGGADAIWHECGHRTAFKSRKLNDFFYHIGSFMNSFEAVRFKWSHSIHHNYTGSIDPHDFEVDGSIFWKPKKLLNFFIIFIPGIGLLNLNKSIQKEILQHALGIKTKVMKECIPDHKKQSCIFISRIYVLLWISITIFSMIINSVLPIFLFLIPKFFATLNIIWGLTQHIGLQDKVKDHRLSTRSIRLNPILSFIYWNMEYHIEHHMFPSVPSYNLPKLHEAIKHQLPKPQTLLQAYKEIIPAIIKKTNDPDYYIPVKIP